MFHAYCVAPLVLVSHYRALMRIGTLNGAAKKFTARICMGSDSSGVEELRIDERKYYAFLNPKP